MIAECRGIEKLLPDLTQIAKTLIYHARDNEHKGEVGIFAVVPTQIAKQFPIEGRQKEDSSPTHITILQLGSIVPVLEKKLLQVVNEVCEATKPFVVSLKRPRRFVNDKGQIILHSPVKSGRLVKFHDNLRTALLNAGIQVDNKFPIFKPHVSIAYCNNKKELKYYRQFRPEGEWIVNSIWIWSTRQPHLVFLGK